MLGSELHKLKKDQKLQRHHYEKMKMIFKKNKQTICCSKRDTRNRSIQSNSIVINGARSKSRRANDSSNSELSIDNLEMDKSD